MIAVLGSGFGLYGHIPALIELGLPVKTLSGYRQKLAARPELAPYQSQLTFADSDLLEGVDTVVLARRPQDNVSEARRLMKARAPPKLVVEKPLAPTPQEAAALLSVSLASPPFTPFLLRWCTWAADLQEAFATDAGTMTIEWGYSAGGTKHSWKSDCAAGGGVLNFYFIHLMAFVVHLFPRFTIQQFTVETTGGTTRLQLDVMNESRIASVSFEAGADRNFFRAGINGQTIDASETPFGPTPRAGARDPRVDALKRFYSEEVFGAAPRSDQGRIIRLWAELRSRAEELTRAGRPDVAV